MKIESIDAFQVFDSRGFPTLEAEVYLENGIIGRAVVPSGASKGRFEVLELRDKDPDIYYGKSVFKAINNIKQKIGPALKGRNVHEQEKLDMLLCKLDGSPNKQNLGANAILGVSMAIARANAENRHLPLFASLTDGIGTLLPLPEIQIIGGGAHSAGRIDIQDFMIICTGATNYLECLEMTYHVYQKCGEILKSEGKVAGVADEGGYWPEFDSNEEVFDTLLQAIKLAGYQPGIEIHLSLDIAASEFYGDGKYHLKLDNRLLAPDEFYHLIADWCKKYPILSIEDPFAETDTSNWIKLTKTFGNSLQIIGDDLFTTDINRVKIGKKNRLANSVLIKPNQIGTISETIACIRQTQDFNWTPVVSARSGETEDTFIAHLAVATNAGQLKVGSFTRSERMVKWNEIIRIARQLGNKARFEGAAMLSLY